MAQFTQKLLATVLIAGSLSSALTPNSWASRGSSTVSKSSNAKWLLPVIAILGLTAFLLLKPKSCKNSSQTESPNNEGHSSIGNFGDHQEAYAETKSRTKEPLFQNEFERRSNWKIKESFGIGFV